MFTVKYTYRHICQWVLWFISSFFFISSKAQSLSLIHFEAYLYETPLKLDSVYTLAHGETLSISTLKFYISDLEYLLDNKIVEKEPHSFHLINFEDEKSLHLLIKRTNTEKFNQLKFVVGIDSITNTSGALGGDLDPTKGMYWAWQSGYINAKIEGECSMSGGKNKTFEFHLGGYNDPFLSAQQLILTKKETGIIHIRLQVDHFFNQIDMRNQHHIMSPGKEGVELSKKFSSIFSLK